MLQLVHIVRDLDTASGGPSRSVCSLAETQSQISGIEVTVLYQDRGNSIVPLQKNKVEYKAVPAWKFLFAKTYSKLIWSDAFPTNECVFHLHGLWSPTLHFAARFAFNNGIPYIISPRGMLSEWCLAYKSSKKKLGLILYQKSDFYRAEYLLATSEAEKKDITSLISGDKVAVIPNGCDDKPGNLPNAMVLGEDAGARWALAIGRLHSVKGFVEFVDVWASLMPQGWKLAIAGADEAGGRRKLKERISHHGLKEHVYLLGEVDDLQKWSLLEKCELFIAPSKSENFGMAIAEALQSGTAVITTTGTPWNDIQKYHCGWWVELNTTKLQIALEEATKLKPERLREMGANGRRLIADKYSWQLVANRTVELYHSIIEQRHTSALE